MYCAHVPCLREGGRERERAGFRSSALSTAWLALDSIPPNHTVSGSVDEITLRGSYVHTHAHRYADAIVHTGVMSEGF